MNAPQQPARFPVLRLLLAAAWIASGSPTRVSAATEAVLPTAAGASAGAATNLFGLTNLWILRLTVSAEDWQLMGSRGGPRERGMGGGPGNPWNADGAGVVVPEPGPGRRGAGEAPPGFVNGLVQRFFGGPPEAVPGGPSVGLERGRVGPTAVAKESSSYPWVQGTFQGAGLTLTNVGVRFKGVSSFVRSPNAYKRPFKLDFGRGMPGRRFLGAGEFYLNNNVNDATQMREALAYDLFRRAGIPAPRTAFAQVYLTIPGRFEGRHLGLYTMIESVDDAFLEAAFGSAQGVLMKPEMMRGLQYFGEAWENYAERYQPREPKGGAPVADRSRFIEFVRFIQQARPEEFAKGLERYLEVEPFARFVALNAILANVDSFIGNGHNYYLYARPGGGRATFMPWDLNESFGMHPVSGPSREQMLFSVVRPNGDPNALVERFVRDPSLGVLYRAQCTWLLTNLFVAAQLSADIDRVASVTRPVVFAESKRARADFERTVLGTMRPEEGDTSQPRHDREFGGEGYRPWGFPDAVEIDNLPLKQWVAGREAQVREELAGRARGTWPRPRLNGY